MELTDQVCSFEQAVELWGHLGDRDTAFYYSGENAGLIYQDDYRANSDLLYPAYSAAELGVVAPLLPPFGMYPVQMMVWRGEGPASWWVLVDINDGQSIPALYKGSFKTEAQAKAAGVLWLLNHGHLKPEEIKI